MANLTEDRNLVRRLSGVAPQPDHYLVVFKRIGEGKKLRACVPPGEPYKKSIFESAESFTAFAVQGDRNLRHRFQRTYRSHDLLHSYSLNFTLDYRVADPATLVEKLDLDPLKRLEDEIDLLLVQRNKSLDWSAVEREQIDLEDVIFNSPVARHRSMQDSTLEQLSQFAATQGFEVKRVVVTRDLPSEEISVSSRQLEASRTQSILAIDHQTRGLEQSLNHNLKDQEHSFVRRNDVADGIADNVKRAITQATDQIRSFDDIQRTMGKVAQIQGALSGMAAGGGAVMPAIAPAIQGGAIAGVLPETIDSSPCGVLLSSISTTLGSVACDPSDRRQLLSSCLHVVAEALKGEGANEETLVQYTGALSALFAKLLPLLSPGQIKLLRGLQDTNHLRRELN